jgi:hypothetical protein
MFNKHMKTWKASLVNRETHTHTHSQHIQNKTGKHKRHHLYYSVCTYYNKIPDAG